MEEIDLKDLFNIFWSKKSQILLIIAIFIVIGFMYSYIFLTPKYQASTSILLAKSNTSQSSDGTTITANDLTLNQKLVSTYSELLKTETVLTQVINNLGINKTVEDLQQNISVSAKDDTEIIEIKVIDVDAKVAQKIANETAQVFISKIAKEYYNMDNVYVVDEAKEEKVPYNVNHVKDLAIFAIIGFVLASIYVLILNMLDTTVKSKEDIEKKLGLTVLTTMPLCNFGQVKGGKR